jgi:transposase
MRYDDFLLVYNAGPEATYKLLLSIMENSLKQSAQISRLENRVKELEERANRNSQNSNKPSSADPFVKPKSRRKKSGKTPGGQKGREGKTLEMSPSPDCIEKHRVKNCFCCGEPLENEPVNSVDKRQVFDIPPQKIIITEHHSEKKTCPNCGMENKAPFPAGVEKPVQYGTYLKSALVYLNQYQMIPYKRALELVSDFYNHQISEGTLFNSISSAYDALEPVEKRTIELLLQSPVNYADETGLRIGGNLKWMHVVCNENLTHYAPHARRGMDAFEDIDILTRYRGILVHDYWKPYFKLVCEHSLCNAHHLRELTGIEELTEQSWPQELSKLLLEIKDFVETSSDPLTDSQIDSYSVRYDLLIEKGYLENPPPPETAIKKRGRKKQSKARNLLDRLKENKQEALAFMYDRRVNFDNNIAERAIRMVKVKQKVSGEFRSEKGAQMFCRIRGYIAMVKKNSLPVLEAINDAFLNRPFMPQQ